MRLICIICITLLLNGCAAVASMPVPFKIANNIHTAYTVYKNIDNNPDNDSWYVSYIKSLFGKEEETESLYAYEEDNSILLNTPPTPRIKLW